MKKGEFWFQMRNRILLIMLCLSTITGGIFAQSPQKDQGTARPPEPAPKLSEEQATANWPTVLPPMDSLANGKGIQRTMRLLATSTAQHRNHVRILFYGQSITEQKWAQMVANDLRRRFPFADLEVQNRAIGGFAAQLLIRPAEHDVYPFSPDLVIFHVYGSDREYEEIIRNIRTRTSAEILMQKDHATVFPLANPDRDTDKGAWWDNLMNNEHLPQIAKKYGCGLVDVRGEWLRYLKTNHLEPKALLVDGVHLNDYGCFVMSGILQQYLVYRPDLASETLQTVQEYVLGKDVHWNKGRLKLEFIGNRVDLLPKTKGNSVIRILVDGKAPSQHPECYAITRPQPNPWASPLALSRVDHVAPLLSENWTLTITEVTGEKEGTKWAYRVSGSLTGEDGSGKSDTLFVSKSGRVKIEPASFFRGFNPPLPVGHTIIWNSFVMGMDGYIPVQNADPARDNAVTVAQGMTNGKHLLELIVEDARSTPEIKAIRIYRPAL